MPVSHRVFTRPSLTIVGLVLIILLLACSNETSSDYLPIQTSTSPTVPSKSGTTVAISNGTIAQYLVKETLARVGLPSDAKGETKDVDGSVHFDPDGKIISDESLITVNLKSLRSDSGRRDNFVRKNTFETNRFPTAEFRPTDTYGLPWPLPDVGETSFKLRGDMTIHGVTTPIEWGVTAKFNETSITGLADTTFTFADFDMTKPLVAIVLSVEDNIRLKLHFTASISQRE